MTTTDDQVTWTKPGPGTWELDASHVGPAPGPIVRRLFAETMWAGSAAGMAEYGAPLAGFEVAWVRGKYYIRMVPMVGANREEGRPPPAIIVRLFTRLHPTFRRCERRAAETFRIKRWRADLRRWHAEWKPELAATSSRLTDIDVGSITDAVLAAHLTEVDAHVSRSLTLHQRLGPTTGAPLGNLMVQLEDWGLDPSQAFRALTAASPATRAPAERLRTIAAAIAAAGADARQLGTLDEIRSVSPQVRELLDAYLHDHGWRLTTGYDLEDRCLIELPDTVVASIRAAGERPAALADDELAERDVAAMRSEVPAAQRAAFDELVADAREAYGLRDENGPLTYEWPAGLLRRALIEAGARLAAHHRLARPEDVFELDVPEIVALLTTGTGPSLEEVAARAEERRGWARLQAPRRLGPDPVEASATVLPPNLQRITRSVVLILAMLEADPADGPLQGTGIGTTPTTGRARVVLDPDAALAAMEPGDIVVAQYTTPTYNAVLAMAGGLVTAEGGPMCHAGIIARELQLPAVIGAAGALEQIPDGAIIEIDPSKGSVDILTVATGSVPDR